MLAVVRHPDRRPRDLAWNQDVHHFGRFHLFRPRPGFDPTCQVKIPAWDDDDIFDFALSFLLYFCLQAKKGVVQDDRTNSISFLNAITEPAYADAITTLMACITNYVSGIDDGYLPHNLCIMGLATQLHTNARTCAHVVIPWVRWTLGMSVGEWDCGGII